jgi:hypothetical protein
MEMVATIITTVRDLLQTLTREATFKRNLLDILTALQLFIALYTVFTRILPLENKLIERDNIGELNCFQWIVFLLNIVG